MVLNRTVDMMLSEDYKDRFRAEYHQLVYRTNKLQTIVGKAKKGALDFELTCSIDLLTWQLRAMQDYLAALKRRAEVENIDL